MNDTPPAASGAALPPFDPTDAMVNAMVRELLAGPRYEFWEDRAAAAWKAGYQAALPAQQVAASGAAPAADALEHGSVAMGSDGEWVSVRRHVRDAAVDALRLAALASREASPAPLKTDALYDSAYIAGAKAGFSAANSDDPNAALASIIDSRSGYLAALAFPQVAPDPVVTTAKTFENGKTWAAYIAGMIETYLGFEQPREEREEAIAGIIERRLWVLKVAAPVQVAPAPEPDGFALVPVRMTKAMQEVTDEEGWQWSDVLAAAETVDEDAESWYSKAEDAIYGMEMEGYAWDGAEWRKAATPMQAPAAADDARDAARYRFIRDVPYAPGLRTVMTHQLNARMDDVIDELLSTPAAKPAEPTLPTQGDAK